MEPSALRTGLATKADTWRPDLQTLLKGFDGARLMERFQAALPADLVTTWLRVEEAYNLRDCAHTRVAYALGVEAGRDMVTVGKALKDGGIAFGRMNPEIVWGGYPYPLGDGARFDPETDVWTPVSNDRAPDARYGHSAVWTGSEMIVWGGWHDAEALRTGARYAPATDTWTPTSIVGAPTARWLHPAVWTGSEMIVWGGALEDSHFRDGARYAP